ncbi:hypothetical protein BURPS305_1104 [Burkholderia pseudomallei 305]|uniref:Uncharacterized protein n=2 Tax=Burkholderia pseudomallei TaxID=28450 RepID=A0A0E1W8B2_BURPE|nr:hypothetical protein BURPS668_1579 [Burkholderia pseudomallei 668]ABN92571.1 hypothetical protein BURPS1106A_1605 [Burkholderia pseudomallei 1106a]ACQ98422.1 conserved hypothetical protein [Burkholderia pseudomallei MSHR346]EBA45890.1 hypothetical protein BURPS305_1104 [Burkholderia pseudomallei 305]EEC33636.1 conserved hypothetical protein [Burkholderia pseudomallei 576]EET09475.1 hypothetical protein BURPS1710A_2031 [Burkholderia pseudomallei 1710a]
MATLHYRARPGGMIALLSGFIRCPVFVATSRIQKIVEP